MIFADAPIPGCHQRVIFHSPAFTAFATSAPNLLLPYDIHAFKHNILVPEDREPFKT